MDGKARKGFRRLEEPLPVQCPDGREVRLEAGTWIRWVSTRRNQAGAVTLWYEDREGNEYVCREPKAGPDG